MPTEHPPATMIAGRTTMTMEGASAEATGARVGAEDIEFSADGVALRGWLFRPGAPAGDAPVVVMAHGYNCLKEFYLDRYAQALADAGMVVLAYDHRNFGAS